MAGVVTGAMGPWERLLRAAMLCLLVGLLAGCSEQVAPSSSGMGMLPGAPPDADAPNQPPEIVSVLLSPARPAPGRRLEAVVTARDPEGQAIHLDYTWEVDGRRLLDKRSEIRVPKIQKGTAIRVFVTASDGLDECDPVVAEARVANRPPRITALEIEVDEGEGGQEGGSAWIVLPQVEDPDGDRISYRYTWMVNDRETQQRSNRFEKSQLERGDAVSVRVTADDGEAQSDPLQSPTLSIENSPPDIVSSPPGLDPSGEFRYTLEVRDRDGDQAFLYALEAAPSGMEVDAESGEMSWRPSVADAGEHEVRVSVNDRHGGVSRQIFRVRVDVGGPPAALR